MSEIFYECNLEAEPSPEEQAGSGIPKELGVPTDILTDNQGNTITSNV